MRVDTLEFGAAKSIFIKIDNEERMRRTQEINPALPPCTVHTLIVFMTMNSHKLLAMGPIPNAPFLYTSSSPICPPSYK
jgi:hypothetical protein